MSVSIVKDYLIELLVRVKPGMCLADLAWHRLTLSPEAELAFSWADVKSKQANDLPPKSLFRSFKLL